jgi:hypothetical protein
MAQKATDKFSHKGAIKGIWSNAWRRKENFIKLLNVSWKISYD